MLGRWRKLREVHVLVQKDSLNVYVFTSLEKMERWLTGTSRDSYDYLIAQVDPR